MKREILAVALWVCGGYNPGEIAGESVGKIIQFITADICVTHSKLFRSDSQRFQQTC